ncbi:MAG: hypothetical protein NTX25_09990, partial [Proteobacteria bacterium]|nr:hypothetical protein [Pseudomonadota bacterium]
VAHFSSGSKTFSIVGIHATPSNVKAELRALNLVYRDAKNRLNDSNIFVLGDLNADCAYYRAGEGFDFFDDRATLLMPEGTDTTVGDSKCNYDRVLGFGEIVASASRARPFNFQNSYRMTQADAKLVSDHYPVEWSIYTGLETSQSQSQTYK